VLDMPLRLGVPVDVGGLRDVVSSPAFATGVGLVLFAAKERLKSEPKRQESSGGLIEKIKGFFREFF